MKVQIYEIQNPADARLCADLGVNFVGVIVGEEGNHEAEKSFEACRAIFDALPPTVMRNAMPMVSGVASILEVIRAVEPDIVHLAASIDELPPESVADIKQAEPLVKVMRAIPVGGSETRDQALSTARKHQHVSDYLILDTDRTGASAIGATGETHDWSISAAIVRLVNIPVILAGGLSPDNVADAVRAVHPYAVDSFTHTNIPGTRRKDRDRVEAFVSEARSALP